MKPRLSLKGRLFAQKYVETQNGTEAAFEVFSCKDRDSAAVVSSMYLKKPMVRAEIEKLLHKTDITPELVTQKLREGLDANAIAKFQGEVTESDIPDLEIRHKYLDTAAKIMELYPSEKVESRSMNIDIELEKMNPEQITALLKGLLKETNKQIDEHIQKVPSGEAKEGGDIK